MFRYKHFLLQIFIVGYVKLFYILQLKSYALATAEDNSELGCLSKWSLCTSLTTLLLVIIAIIYASFWIRHLQNEISANTTAAHPKEDFGSEPNVAPPSSLEAAESRYLTTFLLSTSSFFLFSNI